MKRTRNILMAIYWLILFAAAGLYCCGEFLEVDMALLSSDEDRQLGIVVQMVEILLTLGLVPLALRLFKFQRIHHALIANSQDALLKWDSVRMLILGFLLVSNTLLYYLYGFEAAFGYLAVMVMLTMPFVLPTMNRCKAETEETKVEADNTEDQETEV